jgi:cell division protein FtsZ
MDSNLQSPQGNHQDDEKQMPYHKPNIKVVGLGGGGSNAINRMVELGINGVEFIAANTDYQALSNCLASSKIQLGPALTRGLGAGGDPSIGCAAAKESSRKIADVLSGADMVFLTAGMGGGTGTGAIPVVAQIAQELGIVVIAVVTMPFNFEMGRRQKNAAAGINQLRQYTNTLISIPNDRLLQIAPKDISLEVAFNLADDVLRQAIQGITELITEPGLINVDFSHIKHMMLCGGGAYMSIGHGSGIGKARLAVDQALHHPLLEEVSLDHAAGVIANFTGGPDLTLFEVQEALDYIQGLTDSDLDIIMGIINDDSFRGRTQVILVVTGMSGTTLEQAFSEVTAKHIIPQTKTVESEKSPDVPELSRQIQAIPVSPQRYTSDLDLPAFLRKQAKYSG